MAWDVESSWAPFSAFFQALPFLAVLLAAGTLLLPRSRSVRRLAVLSAVAALALATFMARLGGAVLPWEHTLLADLHVGWLSAVAHLALGTGFPILCFASLALAAWPMAKGRWREAIVALVAGPGLTAILVSAKLAFPRFAPVEQPFFGGPMATPNEFAGLLLGLTILLLWLVWRLKPSATRIGWLLLLPVVVLLGCLPIVGGLAWPGDILAGWFLALLWVPLCLVGEAYAKGAMAGPSAGILGRIGDALGRLVDRIVERGSAWLVALIAIGVALRVVSYWLTPLGVDAFVYGVMGRSFLADGTFTMPWGDVHTYLDAPALSHHYPPLYPVLLSGFYALLGFSRDTTHLAGIITGLAAVLVTWLCSRDLYGRGKALVATASIALSPIFIQNTGQGYSENLVLLLFVATLWAILKSLDRPWFIVLAGILAGLGYLTKSSMGYFFIIAGLGGLAWRLRWRGWKVLRDPAYITAIALFGAIVLSWAWRNWVLFGSWETSAHLQAAYANALAHPVPWLLLSLVTFTFYATAGYLLYLALLPVLPSLARTPKLASEHDSGLWLALGLPLLLTGLIDGALWLIEGEFFLNNARYIGFVAVPAVWLLVRHADLRKRAVRVGAVLAFTMLLAGSLYFAKPTTSVVELSSKDLGHLMRDGDSLGFADMNNHLAYRYFFEVTQDGTRHVRIQITCAADPLCPPDRPGPETLNTTWVYMRGEGGGRLPPEYVLVPDTHTAFVPGKDTYISLWHRGPLPS